ncbi:MAG: hypothetical protein LBI45_07960 [Bacteroidales bacterium]|nr:hypothetical protein [Bacteroidales bacterium]
MKFKIHSLEKSERRNVTVEILLRVFTGLRAKVKLQVELPDVYVNF